MSTFEILGRSIAQGDVSYFRHPVSELNDGTPVSIPVMVMVGERPGPTVLLSGAIHGDEYNGPATVARLFRDLHPRDVQGTVIGVPIMNPFALFARQRVNPFDYEHLNLNRIWPGDPNGFLSQRMAHMIFEEIVKRVDYIVDYHEGGLDFIAEYLILSGTQTTKERVGPQAMQMATWFGAGIPIYAGTISEQAVRLGRAGALSEAAGEIGIPVLGVELGGACTIWPKYVDLATEGTLRVLQGLGVLEGDVQDVGEEQVIVEETLWPRPSHGGFLYPEAGIDLGARVSSNTVLATIVDPFGKVVEELRAPFDCVILDTRFISTVYPGEWTYHCGKIDLGVN